MEFFPTLLLRNVAIIERNDGVFALLKRLIIEHGNWHPSLFQPSLRYSRGGNGKENRRGGGAFLRGWKIRDRYRDITSRNTVSNSRCVRLARRFYISGLEEFQACTALGFIQLLVIVYKI